MHLPAAFQLALKIGKFIALTAFDNLNSISQQRCKTKKCKPSAVELKTTFFSENYFLKVLNLMILSFKACYAWQAAHLYYICLYVK
jgi:hypothetical protein